MFYSNCFLAAFWTSRDSKPQGIKRCFSRLCGLCAGWSLYPPLVFSFCTANHKASISELSVPDISDGRWQWTAKTQSMGSIPIVWFKSFLAAFLTSHHLCWNSEVRVPCWTCLLLRAFPDALDTLQRPVSLSLFWHSRFNVQVSRGVSSLWKNEAISRDASIYL